MNNHKKDHNIKTKNTQNCQKIELYGGPTTKDLKKPNSSKWVGGVETDSQDGEDVVWRQQRAEWVVPHSHVVDKIRRETLGDSDPCPTPDCAAQGSSTRKMKPHNFWL